MPRSSLFFALGPGLLICLGQLGCAQTPAVLGNSSPIATPAFESGAETATADPIPAEINSSRAATEADHAINAVVYDTTIATGTAGYTSGNSNLYIFDDLARYGTSLFTTADYYDWGGFPIYYPHPYTIPSSPNCNRRSGAYGGGSRTHGRCGGFGTSTRARFGTSAGSGVAVANQSLLRATAGKSRSAGVYAAHDGGFNRRPDNGWQQRLGSAPSGAGAEQASGRDSAGQSRSGTYAHGRHRSLSGGGRARQRGVHSSYRFGRTQRGVRRTSRAR